MLNKYKMHFNRPYLLFNSSQKYNLLSKNDQVKQNNLEQYLLDNPEHINTIYGTGVIPNNKSNNKCWKAFLSKINKG